MRFILISLEITLPVLYFGTTWIYARAFFRGTKTAETARKPMLLTTLSVHLLYIFLRTIVYNHPPITTMWEILSLISFTVGAVYSYIEWRTNNRSTGYFILVLPTFFQTLSSLFIKEIVDIPPILRSNLLGFHVSSALLGYAAITISAVYGFLYLMLYHQIKSRQFGVIYKRLPNLEMLERMSFTATVTGFILLSIAITVGMIWLPRAIQTFSYADPKLLGSFLIWAIYAVGLSAKKIGGWRGKRIMVLSVLGFVIAICSVTLVNLFFSGFHKFY